MSFEFVDRSPLDKGQPVGEAYPEEERQQELASVMASGLCSMMAMDTAGPGSSPSSIVILVPRATPSVTVRVDGFHGTKAH